MTEPSRNWIRAGDPCDPSANMNLTANARPFPIAARDPLCRSTGLSAKALHFLASLCAGDMVGFDGGDWRKIIGELKAAGFPFDIEYQQVLPKGLLFVRVRLERKPFDLIEPTDTKAMDVGWPQRP